MIDFFVVFFLSKTIELTDDPISILGRVEIAVAEPFDAITSGASVQIDVSSFVAESEFADADILSQRTFLRDEFPSGAVDVRVSYAGGEIRLDSMFIRLSDQSQRLAFTALEGIPVDVEFTGVTVESTIKLRDVRIYWMNYSK